MYITEPLNTKIHNRKKFDCGEELINNYLSKQANQESKINYSRCYVKVDENNDIVGYYTLSSNSIPLMTIDLDLRNKLPKRDTIPVTLIGMYGRDKKLRGSGLGGLILIDALKRAYVVGKQVASHAIVLDPLNPKLIEYYQSLGFILLDSGKMFISMKRVESYLRKHNLVS